MFWKRSDFRTICEELLFFKAPIPSSTDEFWVLDVPGLEKFVPEPTPETVRSFAPCIPMQFGRFSVNGHNKELERMMERNEENRRMKEIGKIADSDLLTEEEMLETYLSLARKNVSKCASASSSGKKGDRKKNKDEEPDENPDDEAEKCDGVVKSFRRKPYEIPNATRSGKIIKKKKNNFTGLGRKRMIKTGNFGDQNENNSKGGDDCVLQSRAAGPSKGVGPFNVKSPQQKKKTTAMSTLLRQTFMLRKSRGRKL